MTHIVDHSSEKRSLCSTFWPREMLPNFVCLYKRKTQFFLFPFWATLSFILMNALVYVDIDQGIHKGKTQSCSKWKTKKLPTCVFFLNKQRKFWSISWGQKVGHKPLFSEEWDWLQDKTINRHLVWYEKPTTIHYFTFEIFDTISINKYLRTYINKDLGSKCI